MALTMPAGLVMAAPAIARFGGRYLVRGATPEVIEGEDWAPPDADRQQIVVVEFPNAEAIHAWYASPEYAPLIALRQRTARTTIVFVEGA